MKMLKEITRHELIGLNAVVVQSSNLSQEGLKGRIVDETKSSVVLETINGRKRVLKKNVVFELNVEGKIVMIKGKLLEGRPEERIKVK